MPSGSGSTGGGHVTIRYRVHPRPGSALSRFGTGWTGEGLARRGKARGPRSGSAELGARARAGWREGPARRARDRPRGGLDRARIRWRRRRRARTDRDPCAAEERKTGEPRADRPERADDQADGHPGGHHDPVGGGEGVEEVGHGQERQQGGEHGPPVDVPGSDGQHRCGRPRRRGPGASSSTRWCRRRSGTPFALVAGPPCGRPPSTSQRHPHMLIRARTDRRPSVRAAGRDAGGGRSAGHAHAGGRGHAGRTGTRREPGVRRAHRARRVRHRVRGQERGRGGRTAPLRRPEGRPGRRRRGSPRCWRSAGTASTTS